MPIGLFGITDDTLNLVVNLLVLFLGVVWLALIAWTYFDARRRLDDPVLVMCATGASLFPYVGTIVYSILRPPEFLDEKHERELDIRASELRVRQLEEQSCPNCEHPIERTYLRCPNCRARVKHPCDSCGEPVDPRWSLCPYCETALRRAAPAERRPAPAGEPPAAKPKRREGESKQREAEPKRRKAQPADDRKAQPAQRKRQRPRKAEPADDGAPPKEEGSPQEPAKRRSQRSSSSRRASSKQRG